MSLYHLTVLPMKVDSILTLDQFRDFLPTNIIVYQSLIKILISLGYETRPDIGFVVGQFSC